MKQYHELLRLVLDQGKRKTNRTGIDTLSYFGAQARFNLREGFPLVTTKKIYWKGVVGELLWFLRGDTNIHWLQEHGIHIWDEWADVDGNLGPIYGQQWRRWGKRYGGSIDQIQRAIDQIKTSPDSRRIVISAWNAEDVSSMAMPPCHPLFQFYVSDGELSCHSYMRSADLFLGVPFNIASYALLTHMVAHVCGLRVGDFVQSYSDLHIYVNHLDQVGEQLSRNILPAPRVELDPTVADIDGFTFEAISLFGYAPHPAIKAPVAV